MKIIREGFPDKKAAQKEASNMGLTGYIIGGPRPDGTYCIKVMTMAPTDEGLADG